MTVSGVVLSVDVERYGDTLTADTLATDVVLHVGDVIDFADEDDFAAGPQWLTVGDSGPLQYVSVDDDADTVTLAAAVGAVYEAGEPVRMWDAAASAEVVSHVAWVELDEADADDQPIPAEVPHERMIYFGVDNMAGLIGARVVLDPDDDDPDAWHVAEVTGRNPVVSTAYLTNPTMRAYLPAAASVANLTTRLVDGWTVAESTGIVAGAPAGWFYVPTAGSYLVVGSAAWSPNTTGQRYVTIQTKDSTGALKLQRQVATEAPPSTAVSQVSVLVTLEAGDGVAMYVMQTSGAALDLYGEPDDLQFTGLDITRVA